MPRRCLGPWAPGPRRGVYRGAQKRRRAGGRRDARGAPVQSPPSTVRSPMSRRLWPFAGLIGPYYRKSHDQLQGCFQGKRESWVKQSNFESNWKFKILHVKKESKINSIWIKTGAEPPFWLYGWMYVCMYVYLSYNHRGYNSIRVLTMMVRNQIYTLPSIHTAIHTYIIWPSDFSKVEKCDHLISQKLKKLTIGFLKSWKN